MIDYLFTSIYFLTIFLTGFVVVSVIFNGKPRSALETLSSSMLIGAGAVSTIFFWFSLVGVPPTVPLTSALLLASSVAILVFARYGGIRAPTPFSRVAKSEIPFLAVGAIVAAYFFCIILADALLMPLYSIDSFALWCLKAKALFHEGLYGGFFHQPSLSYSHLNYPLSVPFLISGIYVSLGRFDDCLGKLIFPFFYLAGMIFIYSSLRWKLNRAAALCLTLVFISHPVLIRWSAVGIADAPLTMFYAGSVFYLVKFLAEKDLRDCLLSFLFSFFCAFTKNEGMAIAAINVGVLACFHLSPRFTLKKAKTVFAYGFGLLVLLIPWLYWRAGIPATHLEEVSSRYKELWDLKSVARIGEILSL
ncbi:MAG: glycosyltransferase family 39 protein, partial [Kiritimatiellaeota bacterium]|nr:glycosyltransferase family 39 protein [Kiritimatiellota bacterium]